jgi:hypothetical protein
VPRRCNSTTRPLVHAAPDLFHAAAPTHVSSSLTTRTFATRHYSMRNVVWLEFTWMMQWRAAFYYEATVKSHGICYGKTYCRPNLQRTMITDQNRQSILDNANNETLGIFHAETTPGAPITDQKWSNINKKRCCESTTRYYAQEQTRCRGF